MVGVILFVSLSLSLLFFYTATLAQSSLEKININTNTVRIQNSLKEPILDIQLIENTNYCLADCHAIIKLHPYQKITFPEAPNTNFRWDFLKGSPEMFGIKSYRFQILENDSYTISTPIFGKESHDCIIDNTTGTHGTCWEDVQTGSTEETRYRDEYREFGFWGNAFEPGKDYYVKLIGEKYPTLGENNVDWIPILMGVQINEWEWWNGNWNYRQKYTSVNYQGYTVPQFRAYVEMDTANEISQGRMNSNCSSIRAGNDTTEYQVNWENCNTAATSIYVQIPWYVNGTNDFYVYYDNEPFADVRNATIMKGVVLNITLPKSYYGGSAGFFNGKIYACMGYNITYDDDCFVINLTDSTVGTIAAVQPAMTSESNGVQYGGSQSVYQFGGDTGYHITTNKISRYDSTDETVTQTSTGMTARRSMCVAAVDNKIYAMSGDNNYGNMLNTFTVYWANNDTVGTEFGSITRSRCGAWGFNSLDRAYLVGGTSGFLVYQPDIYVIWYANNSVEDTGNDINVSLSSMECGGYDSNGQGSDLLYCLGGEYYNASYLYVGYIWEYNITSNEVKTLNASVFPTRVYGRRAVSDKSIYIIGGITSGGAKLNTIERFDMRVASSKTGNLEEYNATAANESQGDNAIVEGIQNALGTDAPIYSDQQICIRYLNGSQLPGQFDEVVISGNQTWAFNYVTAGETPTTMNNLNLSTTVYIWEKDNLPATNITNQVESLIDATKLN